MALEDIIKRIKEKVFQEVEEIKQGADREREEIIKKAKQEADRAKDELIKKATEEGEGERQRRLMRTRSEERKKILAFKRELIDKVFRQARERLDNLNEEEYLKWSERILLSNIDSGKEEILVSPQDKDLMERVLVEGLEKKETRFLPELNEKERGFIIRKEGVQIDYTFSSLFAFLEDELEIEVARILFGS
jgi:V/A-type H+-transporting ATPase subunit E